MLGILNATDEDAIIIKVKDEANPQKIYKFANAKWKCQNTDCKLQSPKLRDDSDVYAMNRANWSHVLCQKQIM